MDPVLNTANQKIQSALEHLQTELSSIRAGRANPSLVENIPIKAYGDQMKLIELGTIAAPQPNLLTIQVWDVSAVQDVVKGIQEANLGLSPSYEGQTIRLPIPPLTEERREEYIKLVHQKMEDARVEIRQIRQDTRQSWERQKEFGEIGDDEFFRREKLLQVDIDRVMAEIEDMGKQKELELREL
ncbi:ribosome recycling factor [Candidatus Daviesbacteria bacterium]|nr:ribosome recycling factor [Candidatus Daviesbacteria bacterium]